MLRSLIVALLAMLWAAPSISQEVVFKKQAARINDTSQQVVHYDLVAERTIRHHNQLVDTSVQTLRRKQSRRLTVLDVAYARPSKARLRFLDSETRVHDEGGQTVDVTQPVAGNTYLVARTGADLTILDEHGKPISKEEDEILRRQLDGFGKPNPLAEFLDGKKIAVGQQVVVPDAVASELLGLTGKSGKTDKLTLLLDSVQPIDGISCAAFQWLLRSSNRETSMSLLMKGQLVVEVDTCRTRMIRLEGPIVLSEVRGPTQGQFVVSTNGTLKVRVETGFQDDGRIGGIQGRIRR